MPTIETKDLISLALSGLAFALSLIATFITLRQKKFESERTLRQQLTDAIGKLNGAFEEACKLEIEYEDSLSNPEVVSLRSFYNGQKIFYAHQAVYLIEQIPTLVSDAEFNSVARAFLDVGDDENAVLYYKKAIRAAKNSMYRATNLRGLGRTLVQMNKQDEGRGAFEEALSLASGKADSQLWFQAETLQRWAHVESAAEENQMAAQLLVEAEARYSSIQFSARRTAGLKNLAALRRKIGLRPSEYTSEGSTELRDGT